MFLVLLISIEHIKVFSCIEPHMNTKTLLSSKIVEYRPCILGVDKEISTHFNSLWTILSVSNTNRTLSYKKLENT